MEQGQVQSKNAIMSEPNLAHEVYRAGLRHNKIVDWIQPDSKIEKRYDAGLLIGPCGREI